MSQPPPATGLGRARVLGVVGGVGSGKSAVARLVAGAWGADLIDGDAAGHETLARPEVAAEVAAEFGDVLDASGAVDRRKLGPIAFADAAAMARLEAILHPRMRRRFEADIAAAGAAGRPVVFDAAVLLEAGWRDLCDSVAFVDAPDDVRRSRAVGRGWSEERWRSAEASQWPVARKRAAADVTLDNAADDGGRAAAEALAAWLAA